MKFVDERGRKFAIVVLVLVLFILVDVGVVVKIWAPKLDVETMLQAAIGAAALAGAYAGANAWAKQSEAKIAEATGELPED